MARNELSIKGKHVYRLGGWKHSAVVRFLLFLAMIGLFYFCLHDKTMSGTYNIEVGTVSDTAILSPVKLLNEAATMKAQMEAAEKVGPVYRNVSMRSEDLVETIFNKLDQVNADDQVSMQDKVDIYRMEIPALWSDFYDRFFRSLHDSNQYNEALLSEMQAKLDEQRFRIPEETFFKLPRIPSDELSQMKQTSKEIVRKHANDFVTDIQAARTKVPEQVNASQLNRKMAREVVQDLVRFVLFPNKFYDEEGTFEAREQARNNLEPIYIEKNDVLVDQGQVVTEETYELLQELGLLKQNTNYWPKLGLLLFVSLIVFVFYVYIRRSQPTMHGSNVRLVMYVLIVVITVLLMKITSLAQTSEYAYIGYLAPVAVGTMLAAILLETQLAVITGIVFALMSGVIFNVQHDQFFDFRFAFVTFIVCFVSVYSIHRASQRLTILKAGLTVSFFACVAVIALQLVGARTFEMKEVLYSLAFAGTSGILTTVLVIGMLPFFEVSFGILSPLKLVELSNPNHPLLRKLLTETPGTYHHSIMVGNLSEAAAEAIGANGLLCRVGSFYHDVGKTRRPSYFIENQSNIENPHDRIDPKLSKSIIIAHARDGADMLREYKMPKQLCDIAEQHHGTTLLKYFYHKAVKQAEREGRTEPVSEQDFRYPGPKAQTKEAAVVGIADCVEAAVRSMRNPTIEQIDSMVDKIIKDRLDDNQYNECDLTMKELHTIGKALKEALLGIFHSRIEYPDDVQSKNESKGVS